MTIAELITHSAKEVRSNPGLFTEFVRLYTEEKGKKPNCAGCQFESTWSRWVNEHTPKRIKMPNSKNTFELIKTKKYIVVPFSGGQVISEDASDELVMMYLDQVKGEARKVREANFVKLPEAKASKPVEIPTEEAPKAKRRGRKKKVSDAQS